MSTFTTDTSYKSRKTALMLCLIGGIFGLHYLYVGRYGRAIICMFTMNFIMLGWFADMIMILFGGFKDRYGDYLKEW